jgi:hypothetical protein
VLKVSPVCQMDGLQSPNLPPPMPSGPPYAPWQDRPSPPPSQGDLLSRWRIWRPSLVPLSDKHAKLSNRQALIEHLPYELHADVPITHSLQFHEERWSNGQAKPVCSTANCVPFFASDHLGHAAPPLQAAFVHAKFMGKERHGARTEGRAGPQFADLVANSEISLYEAATALAKVT